MNKSPAFQFYPDDFIGGTVDLSAEDVGAYIRLLCYQWGRGTIPETKAAIDRIAGCVVGKEVMAKFPNGSNPKLEKVRLALIDFRNKKAESGKAGAEKRWHSHSTPNGTPMISPMANGMANDSSPVSCLLSPTPIPNPSPISKKTLVASLPNDTDFIKSLKANESYRGIDIDRELGRMTAWCQANRKQASRRRFVNWLNRVDRPITAKTSEGPVGGRF